MSKRIYISADYDYDSGDREVVDELNKWGQDALHKVDFVDMAAVKSGSVSLGADCRACDLKAEFNRQIRASSAVIFVVGDRTAFRKAGCECPRTFSAWSDSKCTPYKQHARSECKVGFKQSSVSGACIGVDVVNNFSYLRHEFEEAVCLRKDIIIVYNSLRNEYGWLPDYMQNYKHIAHPFWMKNWYGERTGNYSYIKRVLGYV